MKNKILAAITVLAIGFGIGGNAVAVPEDAQQEMMQNMMQNMRQCMMQMKEDESGMGMHSQSSGENDESASGDMMQSMMKRMMNKMENCMMQMEAPKDEEES